MTAGPRLQCGNTQSNSSAKAMQFDAAVRRHAALHRSAQHCDKAGQAGFRVELVAAAAVQSSERGGGYSNAASHSW
jgi:hypothetical protein